MNRVIKKIIITLICLLLMNIFIIGISAVTVGTMIFSSFLPTDHSYSGIPLTFIAGESVVFGDMVYMNWADKEVKIAKADSAATVPVIGIALESKSDGEECLVLIMGYIRDDSWDFTSAEVYLSDVVAGGVLSSPPGDSGDQVQKLGFAFHADKMFFNPSLTKDEI